MGDQKTAGAEGTGLGLSIVTTLLDALGARLEIKSKAGEGTHCRVTIPASSDTRIIAPIADAPAGPAVGHAAV